MREPQLHTEKAIWEYRETPGSSPKKAKVKRFDNAPFVERDVSNELPLMVLRGYGAYHTTRRALKKLGEKGIYAVGVHLPHNRLPRERSVIKAACVEIPHMIADIEKEKVGLKSDALIKVLGHSEGGGIWGLARRYRSEGLGDAALIAPVGFNLPSTIHLSENPAEMAAEERRRLLKFVKRFGKNALQQPMLSDPIVNLAGLQVAGQAGYDLLTRRFVPKVGFAVMESAQRDAIEHVNQGHRVLIVAGQHDGVFPGSEMQATIMASQLPGELVPEFMTIEGATHAAMDSRHGMQQAMAAAHFLLAT